VGVAPVGCVLSLCSVSDEKEARNYLQALTAKMSEELENLKVSGAGPASVSLDFLKG